MIGKKIQDHILISTDLLDCAGKTASVFRGSASFVAEFGRSAINVMGNYKRNKLYYTSFYKLYCTTFYTSAFLVNKTREVMFHHKDYSQ